MKKLPKEQAEQMLTEFWQEHDWFVRLDFGPQITKDGLEDGFIIYCSTNDILLASALPESTWMNNFRGWPVTYRKEEPVPISSFSPRILDLAKKYNVKIIRDKETERNQGSYAGDTILLGEFDDPDLEFVAFWHELAHSLAPKQILKERGQCMSKISSEGAAWELAIGLAYENGFTWDYFSKEMVWARNQLGTYLKAEHMEELLR